jgi:hypothetical protein
VSALWPLAVDEPLGQGSKLLALPGRVLATQREPGAHASDSCRFRTGCDYLKFLRIGVQMSIL